MLTDADTYLEAWCAPFTSNCLPAHLVAASSTILVTAGLISSCCCPPLGLAQPWLAVFGGDQAVADEPDVGRLMQLVRQRYDGCRLLAVSFQSVDSHVDHFYR